MLTDRLIACALLQSRPPVAESRFRKKLLHLVTARLAPVPLPKQKTRNAAIDCHARMTRVGTLAVIHDRPAAPGAMECDGKRFKSECGLRNVLRHASPCRPDYRARDVNIVLSRAYGSKAPATVMVKSTL